MINELDLYRTFKVAKGQYEGEYKLYFNRTVAAHYLPENIKIYKWGDNECLNAEAGDYIESYDGSVVILIRKRIYTSKATQMPFYFFRFPMCTITAYTPKTKPVKFREFYAQAAYLNKGMVVPRIERGSRNQKIRFATMIISGVHPFKAYRIAFSKLEPIQINTLHRRINMLITDEVVQKEIKDQLLPLAERLGEEFTDERLVKELGLLLQASRKGSDAHRENIKFIMALLNKLPDAMYPNGKNKKIAAEVPYSEVRPPQLGMIE